MSEHADVVDAVERDGYAIVTDLLPISLIDRARIALQERFDDEADIAEDRGWLTSAHRVSYALPTKDPTFIAFCTAEPLLAVVRQVLHPAAVVAACNGLEMLPGGTAQRLHFDQAEQVDGPPLYLHAVCPLDGFTADNGGTRVVPGSHKDSAASAGEPLDEQAVSLRAAPGSVIVYDGRLWHGGGRNATRHRRRAIHAYYCRDWVQPDWNFPASMDSTDAEALTAEQRRVLGFETGPRIFDRGARRVIR